MAGEPCAKGTAVVPTVVALRNIPNHRDLLPKRLWPYLDKHLVVSGWYPERDFFALLDALVKTIDPAAVGGDTWYFMGAISAQRDLGGTQEHIPEENRVESAGIYRNYARGGVEDLDLFMKRAMRLWGQYHDTGNMEIRGGLPDDNAIVIRLAGFSTSCEGFARLQVGYFEEYARLVGLTIKGTVLKNTARGDLFCEWKYALERTETTEAYVRSLPRPPG